jgi:hypothetical protein
MDESMSDQPRMVKLADLWQRKSAKGMTYFSGFMGDTQLLLFKDGDRPHPTRPGRDDHRLEAAGAGARPGQTAATAGAPASP